MQILKLSWEMVSATPANHAKFYCSCGEHPAVPPSSIPDEYWRAMEKTSTDRGESAERLIEQFKGLWELVGRGEFIRNVKIAKAEVSEPVWQEITALDYL